MPLSVDVDARSLQEAGGEDRAVSAGVGDGRDSVPGAPFFMLAELNVEERNWDIFRDITDVVQDVGERLISAWRGHVKWSCFLGGGGGPRSFRPGGCTPASAAPAGTAAESRVWLRLVVIVLRLGSDGGLIS